MRLGVGKALLLANPAKKRRMHDAAEDEEDRNRQKGAYQNGGHRSDHAARSKQSHHGKGEIHAEHHEIGLGKINQAHDAEDEAERHAHQSIGTADHHASGDRLQHHLNIQCISHSKTVTPANADIGSQPAGASFNGRPETQMIGANVVDRLAPI